MLVWVLPLPALAQQDSLSISQAELEGYRAQARNLVSALEFYLNILGGEEASVAEKETIFHDTYLKIFRDEDVQIEDDLDEKRQVVSNKDVQAYLKDVDFFFTHAEFSFEILSVDHFLNEADSLYFLITTDRHLTATDVDQQELNNFQKRYIELTVNPESKNLKIASIYTKKLSQEEDLVNWWNGLDSLWRQELAKGLMLKGGLPLAEVDSISASAYHFAKGDSLPRSAVAPLDALLKVISRTQLQLGGFQARDYSPLAKLTSLTRLDLAESSIADLQPLRSLTRLEALSLAGTSVSQLSALQFCSRLQMLDISQTQISDLSALIAFPELELLRARQLKTASLKPISQCFKLKQLDISGMLAADLQPLARLTLLEELDISTMPVSDLSPLANLQYLRQLSIAGTRATDVSPLAQLPKLETLIADRTPLEDITPLIGCPALVKLSCDHTHINEAKAKAFMQSKPSCIVLFESDGLRKWWDSLSPTWQDLLKKASGITNPENREALHKLVASIKVLDISGQANITSLSPVRNLFNLQELNASATAITDLMPLRGQFDLRKLDVSHTPLKVLDGLEALSNLEILDASHTEISSVAPLSNCAGLTQLNLTHSQLSELIPIASLQKLDRIAADHTPLPMAEAYAFAAQSAADLTFQTAKLKEWWQALPQSLQGQLRSQAKVYGDPMPKELHKIAFLQNVSLQGINELSPLVMLQNLQTLKIEDATIKDLSPLRQLPRLKTLHLRKSPLRDLSPLSGMNTLRELDFSNTPLEDLSPISSLTSLHTLRINGTQIRDLAPLANLQSLRQLECASADIRRLNPIESLKNLEVLKCFNNRRLNDRKIQRFEESVPGCKVTFY